MPTQTETQEADAPVQEQDRPKEEGKKADGSKEPSGREPSGRDDSRDKDSHGDDAHEGDSKDDSEEEKKPPVDPAKRRRNIILGIVGGLLVVTICLAWWLYARGFESTDDAEVDNHLNPIASRVEGTIQTVHVEDNQTIQAGELLVDLDPRDAAVQVAQAQGNYDQAVAQLHAEDPNVPITQTSNQSDVASGQSEVVTADAAVGSASSDYESNVAKLRQAEATSQKSQSDLVRYKQLLDKEEIAPSDYDQYLSNARANAASVDAAAAAAASSRKVVDQRQAQLLEQQAKYRQTERNGPRQVLIRRANVEGRVAAVESSRAQLEQAKLNLGYGHIYAPVGGVVTQRSAETGGRISAGTQLLIITQIGDPWVTANFKENQLRKMHVRQRVEIKVDALGETFTGFVESMPASTGDRTSILPPENATGNYVKVTQRLPVRIRFDGGQRDIELLRPGMSVEPKVTLK